MPAEGNNSRNGEETYQKEFSKESWWYLDCRHEK